MKVRLGYVANALRLPDCSPSRTITFKNIQKINDSLTQMNRLITISRENLANTLRILKANFYDEIAVYRFSSKLIPLATHPQFREQKIIEHLTPELTVIGEFVKEHHMRVGFHPDHFTLLNSPNLEVQESSIRDLQFHTDILKSMGIESIAKLVIHVGGKYDDKQLAIKRFRNQFDLLPPDIRSLLTLENDDRCFGAGEVLQLANELTIPMVLDVHHHQLLNNGKVLDDLLPAVFSTWGNLIPKVHLSSPRDNRDSRSHADYIEINPAIDFLERTKTLSRDYDIMIEAKQKDLALFKLAAELTERGYNLPTVGEIFL